MRTAPWAHSASVARSVALPRRSRPERRLPALSLFPGATPAQAATLAVRSNPDRSGPNSTRIAQALPRSIPGTVSSRRTCSPISARPASSRASNSAMLTLAASWARSRSRSFHTACGSSRASRTCSSKSRLRRTWPLSEARCCFLVYFARFVSHSSVTEWSINRIDVKQQDETQWVPSGVWHVTYGR